MLPTTLVALRVLSNVSFVRKVSLYLMMIIQILYNTVSKVIFNIWAFDGKLAQNNWQAKKENQPSKKDYIL